MKKQAHHTPGPWKTQGFENLIVNSPLGNTIVCSPGSDTGTLIEMKSNARLIAAAPELLYALKQLMNMVDFKYPYGEEVIQKAEKGV